MLIKIWKEEDLKLVSELSKKVKENVQILAEEYRKERLEKELGGYIAITDEKGIRELKEMLLKI